MNKLILALVFVLSLGFSPAFGQSAGDEAGLYGATRFDLGLLHAGSYRKERPIFFLEQEVGYRFNDHGSVGIGAGIDLYPGALALPVYVAAAYSLDLLQKRTLWQTSVGVNLPLGDPFFFSYRNVSSVGIPLLNGNRMQLVPKLGYILNMDRYVGGSLSALLGIDLRYRLN